MTRKRARFIAILMTMVLCTTGCTVGNASEDKAEKEIYAMDTIMTLTMYGEQAETALKEAETMIYKYDALFSVTDDSSDVATLNAASGSAVTVDEDTYDLVQRCIEISDDTEGLFDISIYPLVKAWGFTTEDEHVPSDSERTEAMAKVDYENIKLLKDNQIQLDDGMQIDLGGIAKGFLSQKIMDMCKENGVDSAIVSLGGNVQTIGTKEDGSKYVVGITDPSDGTSIYGTLEVEDKAVVTSGIYQRYFEEDGVTYHHIMDVRTGMPADNDLASVTVIADDGGTADALATALYVMGEDKAIEYQKKHPDIQIILIRKDGSYLQSEGAGMTTTES